MVTSRARDGMGKTGRSYKRSEGFILKFPPGREKAVKQAQERGFSCSQGTKQRILSWPLAYLAGTQWHSR
jgi:hypothetical protein